MAEQNVKAPDKFYINALKVGDKVVKDINGKKIKNIIVNGRTYEIVDTPTPTTKTLSGVWHFKNAVPEFQDFDVNMEFYSKLIPPNISAGLEPTKLYTSIHVSSNGLGEMRYDDDYVYDGDMSLLTNTYAYIEFANPQEVSEEFYNWFTSQAEEIEVGDNYSNIMAVIPAGSYNFKDTLEVMPTYADGPQWEYLNESGMNFITADGVAIDHILIFEETFGGEVNGETMIFWMNGEWQYKPDMITVHQDVIVPIEFWEWFMNNLVEHNSGGAN